MSSIKFSNSKKVIIVGAGGHAAELDEYIRFANRVNEDVIELIGLIDDDLEAWERYRFNSPFLGSISEHIIRNDVHYLIGIANINYRGPITKQFIEAGAKFLTFIHPSAYISESATIGRGTVIAPNVSVGPMAVIGEFNTINARCSIGHDSIIEDFNFLSPNVCFSGHTHIGSYNLFGINSATIPSVEIGNRNKVMAGMVLNKNVGDGETVFFRYKERVIAVPKPN
jgi:sugar O-acyltransferase (sialic acid O-acetyltransferase NeuD family)